MYHTYVALRSDEQSPAHHELAVYPTGGGISGEVYEEWVEHHTVGRLEIVDAGAVVGLVEQSVVVRQEGVADGQVFTTDGRH